MRRESKKFALKMLLFQWGKKRKRDHERERIYIESWIGTVVIQLKKFFKRTKEVTAS